MPNGGWQSSTRAARLPPDWHARRARCYRTANGQCQWVDNGTRCPTRPPLHKTATQPAGHADHINRDAGEQGPLQWLCQPHHQAKSSTEGHQAAHQARAKAKHPTEQHPATRTQHPHQAPPPGA